MEIERLDHLEPEEFAAEVESLVLESEQEGFNMLRRLADDFESGANRFDLQGEALFGCYNKGKLIAIGGLNIDPFEVDPFVGRVRRLYVSPACRRRGVGGLLMDMIRAQARSEGFRELRLRTDTVEAAAFYERIGFEPTPASEAATHRIVVDSE